MQISSVLKNMYGNWCEFWFAPKSLYAVSLFRLLLGLAMLYFYSIRAIDMDLFFTSQGVLPADQAMNILPPDYRSVFTFFLKSDFGIRFQVWAHLFLIILFTLGVLGRKFTWLLFIVNLGLMQRNMSIVYGADLFGSFWLLYLSLVQNNRFFSVLNLFKPERAKLSIQGDFFSSVGIRFIQLQLCLSYAYTGIEKLKGSSWWEGSAIWYVLGMDEFVPYDLSFLKSFPVFVALSAMMTIVFEIYFIFAIWNKKLRLPWLIVGASFHLGIALLMNLWFFCWVMVSAYLVFLDDSLLKKSINFVNQKILRINRFAENN